MPCTPGYINITVVAFFGGCVLIAEAPKNQKALVDMNGTLPSALVHRPPKVITPTSRHAPCPLAARQTSAGAYRMRPYGFRFRPKGESSTRGTALSWPPLRGGSARRRWGRETCGGQEYFGLRLSKNICRGEHCSPVPACLTRKLSRKMRCGGKLTGDQWSPLHTQQGKTCPSPPLQKRRGGFHIRPCPLAVR